MTTYWSTSAVKAFELFFRPWMKTRLANVCLTGIPGGLPEDHTVIVAANHTSWWDAFLVRELHRRAAGERPLVTLMEERQLRQFPFFRWMGVVGLNQSLTSIRRVCSTLHGFRSRGPFWVSMFPQGSIRASWDRPLDFRPGLGFFARMVAPSLVLPVSIHLEMLDTVGPSAFVAAADPIFQRPDDVIDVAEVEGHVADRLDAIYRHISTHGEDSVERWPPGEYGPVDSPAVSPEHLYLTEQRI